MIKESLATEHKITVSPVLTQLTQCIDKMKWEKYIEEPLANSYPRGMRSMMLEIVSTLSNLKAPLKIWTSDQEVYSKACGG